MSATEKSHPFYVYSGLLTPEHVQKIGSAWAVFLWCLNRTTHEINGVGYVNGEREVNATEIAKDVGGSRHTIYRHLQRLETFGYINLETVGLSGKGWIITVLKSKRWSTKTPQPVSDVQQAEAEKPVSELQQASREPVSNMQQANSQPVSDVQQDTCTMYARRTNESLKATNKTIVPEKEKSTSSIPETEHPGISLSKTEEVLSLDADTATNRWLLEFRGGRPGAGNPLAPLTHAERISNRRDVDDLIFEAGEEVATALIRRVFLGEYNRKRPSTPSQGVYFCQKLLEEEAKKNANGKSKHGDAKSWHQDIIRHDSGTEPVFAESERVGDREIDF